MAENKEVWVSNGNEFSVGDGVRVSRFELDYAENGMGTGIEWENSWCHGEMDAAIGGEFIIVDIRPEGVELANFVDDPASKPHGDFLFPLSALDPL